MSVLGCHLISLWLFLNLRNKVQDPDYIKDTDNCVPADMTRGAHLFLFAFSFVLVLWNRKTTGYPVHSAAGVTLAVLAFVWLFQMFELSVPLTFVCLFSVC